jgi:hypothetical protein
MTKTIRLALLALLTAAATAEAQPMMIESQAASSSAGAT